MSVQVRETPLAPRPSLRSWLIGKPLPTDAAPHQTISKKIGLAVFASDALSSTAYATEEILIVLALAGGVGSVAYLLSVEIAIAIAILLAIVTISYQQTIHAYPGGGGAYIVSRDNLGENTAQVAGAALLVDYILTVSVSISAGVAQITSAFQFLAPYRVELACLFILMMTVVNLRGVKESGVAFAIPTYFFLAVTALTIVVGFFRYFTGSLGTVDPTTVEPMHAESIQALSLFLILRAFSSGCTALTGVEAISNGIMAFQQPRSRNAGVTLIWMSAILSTIFIAYTVLASDIGAIASHEETIVSQIARTVYGADNVMYFAVIGGTMLILIMAANTAYADFPRLAALIAHDGFLPKQLTYRGSRLVFSYGIIALAGFATLLVVIFNATTTNLIPLYAIGVFLSFTLSQTGMAIRWWRSSKLKPGEEVQRIGSILHHEPNWRWKLGVNAFGAVLCFTVMCIFAVTKFAQGAWIVVIVIPTLVTLFFAIHRHYKKLSASLSLDAFGLPGQLMRNKVIVAVGGVHRGSLHALQYARALSPDVTAVHVSVDPDEEPRLRERWEKYGDGVRLVIIPSPYRQFTDPLLGYIRSIARQRKKGEILTIVVPEFVPSTWWHNLLHMNTAFFLQLGLLRERNVVITEVPYHVDGDQL